MAATITVSDKGVNGNKRSNSGTGNLGTYATGGIAVGANDCGLSVMDELDVQPAGGYVFEWDKTNGKVKAYLSGTAGAVLNQVGAVDLSGVTFRWSARGF